jgi:ABC-type glucose/galactose transport system permease subunit
VVNFLQLISRVVVVLVFLSVNSFPFISPLSTCTIVFSRLLYFPTKSTAVADIVNYCTEYYRSTLPVYRFVP